MTIASGVADISRKPDEGKGIIYGLRDPRTDEVRYVGKTTRSLSTRILHHMKPWVLETYDTHLTRWLRQLKELGLKPIGFLIEELSIEDLNRAEIFWIKEYRSLGFDLVNTALGGTGGITVQNRKLSLDHKTKLFEGLAKARAENRIPLPVWTEERRKATSERRKGMQFTDEHRNNISLGKKNKKQSLESVEKRARKLRGRTHSSESILKMSASKKGKNLSPEHIKKLSKKKEGTKASEETKEKIRQGNAKLSWEKVAEIRILLEEKELSHSQIALLYGVSARAIRCIEKEETWKIESQPKI